MEKVSLWFEKYADKLPAGGKILDLACGRGRHSAYLLERGYRITAVDVDIEAFAISELNHVDLLQTDLEKDGWPFGQQQFEGIIVVNYLWREHFPLLIDALKPNGVLIFDTFMVGNEKYGRPSNPKFLLKPGELEQVFSELDIMAFKEGFVDVPKPAIRQSIVAQKR